VLFSIHPSQLFRVRQRCKPTLKKMTEFPTVFVDECNICGSKKKAIISEMDRYGFPARTAVCLHCGLIYIVDRFTVEGYTDFYHKGIYRELISKFKGKPHTIEQIKSAQVNYTGILIRSLEGLLPVSRNAKLLDVGGSTGLVARAFVDHFGFMATVLDPAPTEIDATESLGLKGIVGSIEDWETKEEFDLILLCRTVEHLYDLKKALTKIRKLLKPNGYFYCDIADFPEICRREGPPQATTKIDHVFWLSQETVIPIFNSLGFELITVIKTLPPDQIGFLLRASELMDLKPVSLEWGNMLIRKFREIETDWQIYGRESLDFQDWLKKWVYKAKRKFF
jgi:SAM-dependent methyltransferase